MASGTPGFVGSRLKEAREARGLTGVQLIEALEIRGVRISSSALTKYEASASSPGPEVFPALAEVLSVPPTFLLKPPRATGDRTVFFRSQAAATKRARVRAERKLDWLADVSIYLQHFAQFPPVNMPKLGLPDNPVLISDDDVELAAAHAREFWRMHGGTPVGNMTTLLENQGAVIAYHPLDADKLDSLSSYDERDGRPYIIVGTEKSSAARWRFDLAHELGHLLLHQRVTKTQWNTSEIFKRIEEQANRFAGAFLLPFEAFSEELYAADLNRMRTMKMRWNVSIQAMIKRARHTELIDEATERSLWITLSRRGWRSREPFDDTTLPEEPTLLRSAFEAIMENRAQTTADIEAALSLDSLDIERLCGLPTGYLSRGFAPVKVIQFPTQSERNG